MKPAFDIFRKDLLGTPVWMESVQDVETAKLRLTELARRSPGEYFCGLFRKPKKSFVKHRHATSIW